MASFKIKEWTTLGVDKPIEKIKWEASYNPEFDILVDEKIEEDPNILYWNTPLEKDGVMFDGSKMIYIRVSVFLNGKWSEPFVNGKCKDLDIKTCGFVYKLPLIFCSEG